MYRPLESSLPYCGNLRTSKAQVAHLFISDVLYGSEATWANQIGFGEDSTIELQYWYIQNVLGLTNFTWQDLSYSTVELAESLNPGNATADDYDLSAFFAHGGKLPHWHGLSDATVSPSASVYYHDHVLQTLAPQGWNVSDSYELFLVPGLEHCSGTPANIGAPWYIAGPTQASYFYFIPDNVVYNTAHDMVLAMQKWVEEGPAPLHIVAAGFYTNSNPTELKLNRRIFPYPKQAFWLGSDYGTGSYIQEDNWNCTLSY